MKHILPNDMPMVELYHLLTASISPRPIALVSTLDTKGIPNLAPFSFFTVVGINPPLVAFTPIRRMRNGTQKHTCLNIQQTKECVIQVVTHSIVEQVNLASGEYESGVNEFLKSGLTPVKSEIVEPFRVKESPVQMECILHTFLELGGENGSGDLIICKIVTMHIAEELFKDGIIDPNLLDVVGRNGASFYTRSNDNSLFEVEKPQNTSCIGYDILPECIKFSNTYSANDLAKFANSEYLPSDDAVSDFIAHYNDQIKNFSIFDYVKAFAIYKKEHDYKAMLKVTLSLHMSETKKQNIKNRNRIIRMLEKTTQTALGQRDNTFAWNTALFVAML